MIKKEGQVSRKMVKEARIAICPHFGCTHLEKIKPLKFGILGFRKYPKCSKHKLPLVFVDEFVGNFLNAINTCLFDMSSLPPEDLTSLIKTHAPKNLKAFVNGWMYCNPIGRGAQIVSNYMDGLSRGYIKLLSRKQRKSLQNEKHSKIRYHILRSGLEKIAREYATFLKGLREKSEVFHDPRELRPLSDEVRKLLKTWLKGHLKKIHVVSGKYKSESVKKEETLPLLKEKYDKILHTGTYSLLLGKSPAVVTKGVSPFELFSAYHEFLKAGLCRELKREDVKSLLEESKDTERALGVDFDNAMQNESQTEIPEKNVVNNKEDVNISTIKTINSGNEQKLTKNKHRSFPLNAPNFKERVMNDIRNLVPLLEPTDNQKELILEKAEDILNQHISRAERGDITIRMDANPLTNATAIVYAVLVSNENMPSISQNRLSDLAGIHSPLLSRLYNRYYRTLVPELFSDFQNTLLIKTRKAISLFVFKLLLEKELSIPLSEIVLRIKDIIINRNINTPKERNLLEELTEREIEMYQDMLALQETTFTKYFFDLVNIIKLLIISNKSHKIIDAKFSVSAFVKFLMKKGFNLSIEGIRFYNAISHLFNFLKNTKYSNLFPTRTKSEGENIKDGKRVSIIGNRIKIYIIKHIYKGKYFRNGIAMCLDCLREGFTVNTYFPRVVSKEFHHSGTKTEEFSARSLYHLFVSDRGNPYFLPELIKRVKNERVELKCGSHHALTIATNFNSFKKFISWENIPSEFPQDILELPAEIIHMIALVCVDNFYKCRGENIVQKRSKKDRIIFSLRKKYIIDTVYGGVCPACGEFNTKVHLPAFHFNHLYKLEELTPEERKRGKEKIIKDLFYLPCSEIVKEMERQKGGYVCHNCHFVIHTDMSVIDKIHDDQNIIRRARKDIEDTTTRYQQNLIRSSNLIKDPFKSEVKHSRNFTNFFLALFEISKRNQDGVTRKDLLKYLGSKNYDDVFERRRILGKYIKIVDRRPTPVGRARGKPTRYYYINDEGRRIVRLVYHFRDFYRDYRN